MRRPLALPTAVLIALAPALLAGTPAPAAPTRASSTRAPSTHAVRTTATYFNDARHVAADPYVLHDRATGYYYAYSTDGADPGWYFAIYRSADLVTWQKLPGGALRVDDPKQWANDWFWAPEVYHNPKTGLYFLFYAGKSDRNAKKWFVHPSFEEPSKTGVAVSRSPAGPFRNIADHPIDYYPFDPNYHDVNLIMGPAQKKPPATHAAGLKAPTGTYIPFIDPDVFFDTSGEIYLYYSRNAYRNWVWDNDLRKYIEESNIYAVGLTRSWWNDPTGRTMPTITPRFRNSHKGQGDERANAAGRKDGWVRILDYSHDKQAWENADVNDYRKTHGGLKDRRWEEGSTTWKVGSTYYLTYSANNWESPQYGVGYATGRSPLGPWKKYAGNPILHAEPKIGEWSTGHGSIAESPDGRQLYYVHHGRPTPTAPQRRLYTDRLYLGPQRDSRGNLIVRIDESTGNEPVPSGVAPYTVQASAATVRLSAGATARLNWSVSAATGARLALANPLNRVRVDSANPAVVRVEGLDGSHARLRAKEPGTTWVTLTYQREKASGAYADVYDLFTGGWQRASTSVRVTVTG